MGCCQERGYAYKMSAIGKDWVGNSSQFLQKKYQEKLLVMKSEARKQQSEALLKIEDFSDVAVITFFEERLLIKNV